jgi:transposase
MENNSAERELRTAAVGRRAWLFYGSDDHAGAAGNVLSLIASCKLHGLDPELYLAEIIRIVPYWPRDQYLELAPKYWRATRARLSPKEIELPLGHITVPPPPSKEQPSSD